VVGLISDMTGNMRLGFLFLLVMLAIPVQILRKVDMEKGGVEARAYSQKILEAVVRE
jgi:UMF1 family MFS transporter